jgi:glycosyltransferase involved in cell wall biosynthesis
VFFVGNEGHHPNRLAIEWLARCLAPCLARIDPTIRIKIVGASGARQEQEGGANIDYLGVADRATVAHLFRTADMLICPVENDFGSKFKLVEAISFATPILATQAALSSAPFLSGLPTLQLGQPQAAAQLIARVVADRHALQEMSSRIAEQSAAFRRSQAGVWADIVKHAVSGAAQASEVIAPRLPGA